MKQEDKELLLKGLCARLPYGITCSIYRIDDWGVGWRDEKLSGYFYNGISYEFYFGESTISIDNDISKIKPYLRPMSSMTEEEKKELKELHFYYADDHIVNDEDDDFNPIIVDEVHCSCIIDWLNKHHFDYRGLISKDLAIEVTEENNPYKE